MKSLSEIETTSKRAARAAGFSWGISEEVGKCVRLLELFGLPGIVNLNSYLKEKNINDFENLKLRNNLEILIKCSLDSDIKVTSNYYTKKYADTVIVIATKV